jgi:type I restriction enzyme M protein
MRKDARLNGDLDRLPQLSWILFLKCYDDLELRREEDAKVSQQVYKPVIPPPYRWPDWPSDENEGTTGEDLIKFVNDGLLPSCCNRREGRLRESYDGKRPSTNKTTNTCTRFA